MKLYRGLKTKEYIDRGVDIERQFKAGWVKILEYREAGDLSYPEDLNDTIVQLFKLQPLTRQYFTDNKLAAASYAKKEKGILLELTLPINDILRYFIIEFQNYSKRKESFEISYIVRGIGVSRNFKKGKLGLVKT